jgi:hypothetical protein
VKAIDKLLSLGVVCASLSASYISPAVAQMKLGVIDQTGAVQAYDLTRNTLGPGVELTGTPIAGSNDQFALGKTNGIDVVNIQGKLWSHTVDNQSVFPGYHVPGSLYGRDDTRDVLSDGGRLIYVINTKGEVWAHYWTADGVSDGYKLNGLLPRTWSSLGHPDDKYVVWEAGYTYGGRILVVNWQGGVWAHDLSCSIPPTPPSLSCTIDTVGTGYKLNGPTLFFAPNDKYVVVANDLLMVINTLGEVWARNISHYEVGPGYKLTGPKLFPGNEDRFVVVYDVVPPPK